jgi:hypothetical protein
MLGRFARRRVYVMSSGMSDTSRGKDPSIEELIGALGAHFGSDSFDIVDHWESDLCAIGIARRDDHRVLAYLSTLGRPEQPYYVELELPPDAGDDVPYRVAGQHHPSDFATLARLVGSHLGLASRDACE